MKAKIRRTHLREPYHLETTGAGEGKFTLTFSKEDQEVVIHLERWWINFLIRDLKNVVLGEQEELDRLKESFSF